MVCFREICRHILLRNVTPDRRVRVALLLQTVLIIYLGSLTFFRSDSCHKEEHKAQGLITNVKESEEDRIREIAGGDEEIATYLTNYATECKSRSLLRIRMNFTAYRELPKCDCISPLLKGRLTVVPREKIKYRAWKEIARAVGRHVEKGGQYKPVDCLARLRVAIVIPFRDRDLHLRTVMSHLHPVLQRQQLEYRIFVVEQGLPVVFNKASMMNIGYLEAGKVWPEYDCIVFHDVDMLMEDDRNLVRCGPHHMGVYTDKFRYKMLYKTMFGGVLAFTKEQFYYVNGFSNNYFGWGGEDDDMYNRVKAGGLNFTRPARQVARYTQIPHSRDGANRVNRLRFSKNGAYRVSPDKYKTDGVKQIKYELLQITRLPLYTWIHVNLDTSNLDFTLDLNMTFYNYTKVAGRTCSGEESVSRRVSLVTCRFFCDQQLSCAGFAFSTDSDTGDLCHLKTRVCGRPHPEANTDLYVKEPPGDRIAAGKHHERKQQKQP